MVEVIQSIVALIVTLSILVTFHEFGHYWVARLCGVHVLRFSVGFGKPIYMRRGRDPAPIAPPPDQDIQTRANQPLAGTEFAIAAIPLGGYVKMLDEREGYVPDDQLHLAFNRKPVMQRVAIIAAGPIANFLLAIIAYWMLFSVGVTGVVPKLGEIDPESMAGRAGLSAGDEIVAIDQAEVKTWSDANLRLFERLGESGEIVITVANGLDFTRDHIIPIHGWLQGADEPRPAAELGLQLAYPEIPAVIGGVIAGGRAEAAGLHANDKVLTSDGVLIESWVDWVEIIQASPEKSMTLTMLRDNVVIDLVVVPALVERDGKTIGFIGAQRIEIEIPADMQRIVRYPVYAALVPALARTWDVTVFTLVAIKKMIVGAISHKNLSGPITIAQVANATAQSGIESFVGFIALLSISLGVLNLLPIPILDGGHLLYCFVELCTGREVPERIQLWGLQMGMFMIMGLMMLAFYNDLTRL
jgi:regulator of sigma E protease